MKTKVCLLAVSGALAVMATFLAIQPRSSGQDRPEAAKKGDRDKEPAEKKA